MEIGVIPCGFPEESVGDCDELCDVFIYADNNNEGNHDGGLKPVSEVPLPRKSSLKKGDNQRRESRKKTVSFSSATPDDKTIASASDCIYFMQSGSVFIKLKSNGRQYKRVFLLSSDLKEITWHPSSKKPDKAKITIDQIKEISYGRLSTMPKSLYSHNGCFFSIITGDSFQSLDLIANSANEANIWITGLNFLKLKHEGGNLAIEKPLRDKWLESMFQLADVHKKGVLVLDEVVHLMKRINNNLSSHQIQRTLREMSVNRDEDPKLSCSEFVDLFKKISARPDILSLFIRYAKKVDYMTCEELKIFAETEQGVNSKQIAGVTTEKCREIIATYEPSAEGRSKGLLGIDGEENLWFSLYLMSDEGRIFDPNHLKICQDMDQPLCHYFIASSCNTGSVSAQGFESVLTKGCRYLTVDCQNGPNDEPVVMGDSLFVQSFRTVIEVINERAFAASPYPLIINLLNRCCPDQQKNVVLILKEIFNDKLPRHEDLIRNHVLASPECLRNKIILMSEIDYPEDEIFEGSIKKEKVRGPKVAMVQELRNCIHFNLSHRRGDLNFLVKGNDLLTSTSLNESLALKLSNVCYEEILQYNKRYLTIITPNITREDFSNYHPHDFWNCGCQLVSLNYETNGAMMDLNDGMFSQNGHCGYVLKPPVMRDEISSIKADSRGFIPGISAQILYVRIISALNLPKPQGSSAKGTTLDPYVTVEVIGIPSDCAERRTRTIQHLETSTTSPMFEETFEFALNLPDLAMIRFAVLDDEYLGDDFIGQCTLPLACVRQGYRHVPLKTSAGEVMSECFLFVHIAFASRKRSPSAFRGGKKRSAHGENLKLIGLKMIDDNFKSSSSPMKEANDLMMHLHESFCHLRQSCDLASMSNTKQTVKHLFSRIQSTVDVSLEVEVVDGYPILRLTGNVPDVIRKSILAFENFIIDNFQLQTKAGEIIDKLRKCRCLAMELHEDLPNILQIYGIKGNKMNKAIENCAWNIRLLKGLEDLLKQAKMKSTDDVKQIIETSKFLGLIREDVHSDQNLSDKKQGVPR